MSALPTKFHQIRLELAREHDHPEGGRRIGYALVAPLTDEDHNLHPYRVVAVRPA